MNKRYNQPQEHYIRIQASLYETPAFRTLPPYALKLWVDLRSMYRGPSTNGNIAATLRQLRHRGWVSAGTLNKATWELLHRGLLRRIRAGRPGPFRLCSLYAFTDEPTASNQKLGIAAGPATREYARWVDGHEGFAPDRNQARREKSPLRKTEQSCAENRKVTSPNIGTMLVATDPKIGAETTSWNPPKGAPVVPSSQIAELP